MSERISATEGALARGAEAVSGTHVTIHDSTRRVLDELDELSGHWSGEAAQSYSQLVSEWAAGADKLNTVLVRLEEALRATERAQAANEQEHRATIGGLGALLGGE
ncbi:MULTISPECIES: WXG100 family type VII secretion target [unclassified Microbacterium]|uniref:WXG100 family type VII secretion target n=1 Tax=unclassified Microbacterium TaxID=2609290 RepID=UPI003746EB4A